MIGLFKSKLVGTSVIPRINKIDKMHEYIYFWRFAKNL